MCKKKNLGTACGFDFPNGSHTVSLHISYKQKNRWTSERLVDFPSLENLFSFIFFSVHHQQKETKSLERWIWHYVLRTFLGAMREYTGRKTHFELRCGSVMEKTLKVQTRLTVQRRTQSTERRKKNVSEKPKISRKKKMVKSL